MKFDPSWKQIALLAVLLSGIIAAHLLAPGAISAITSIASTIVGALFVNLQPQAPAPPRLAIVPDPPKDGGAS